MPVNYFNYYPEFKIEEIEFYQAVPENSPLADPAKKDKFNWMRSLCKKVSPPKIKKTAYESMHLIVRYQPEYVAIRNLISKKVAIPGINKFPVEIQIRTILQHTWAQIEHVMNYNPTKSSLAFSTDSLFKQHFLVHKSLLSAGEHHQRMIYEKFLSIGEEPSLKEDPVADSRRFKYFKSDEIKKLSEINNDLHSGRSNALEKLFEGISNLNVAYNTNFLKLSLKDNKKQWSRKRAILLMLGYMFSFGRRDDQRRIVNALFENQQPDVAFNSSGVAVILYEHIRFMDTYFRGLPEASEEDKKFFSDPLVLYRSAGAYLKFYDYRRAIYILQEALSEEYFKHFKGSDHTDGILNEMHFHRRIGEYYFLHYIRYGNFSDLINACQNMEQSFASLKGPSEQAVLNIEKRKSLSNLAVFNFYKFILHEKPCSDLSDFRVYMNKYKNDILALIKPDSSSGDKEGRGHALQASAIFEYYQGNVAEACKLIEKAKKIIDEKSKNPLHHSIVKHVHDYLRHQCSK